mgnify:CR=1 FL=1
MTVHVSLDLETWGTRPGCDIRSIGAVVFDPVMGEMVDIFYIACDNPQDTPHGWRDVLGLPPRKYPLHRDPQTVQWWNAPEQAAASTAFDNPVDLREALVRFTAWMYNVTRVNRQETGNSNALLWSHGPAFDPPILAEAYHAVGLPVPWHYRAPRDTRTLFDVAGIEDHSAWLRQHPGPMGVPHHALDDVICQARAVCAAWGRVAR